MLFQRENRVSVYILKASAFTVLTSISLVVLIHWLFGLPESGPSTGASYLDFLGVVLFAPIVETFLMILSLKILLAMTGGFILPCTINAALWSGFHALLHPLWGVLTLIPFFVFSIAYLKWKRHPNVPAFTVPLTIHSALNLSAFILIWIEGIVRS